MGLGCPDVRKDYQKQISNNKYVRFTRASFAAGVLAVVANLPSGEILFATVALPVHSQTDSLVD